MVCRSWKTVPKTLQTRNVKNSKFVKNCIINIIIHLQVVDDYICIEGKHEERSDEHGFISRQFNRRYKLPDNVDKVALTSSLSSDGVLQLHAPKKALTGAEERSIPITQTNQPAIEATNKKQDKKMEKMES